MNDDKLTVSDAARELGVTPAAIKMAIRRGSLDADQVEAPNRAGFYYTIHPDELRRYRKEHARTKTTA